MALTVRNVETVHTDVPRGEVFYVSPNGSDSNPGNRRNPFKTITAAIAACVSGRGDTVIVGPGNYFENVVVAKNNVKLTGLVSDFSAITQILGQDLNHTVVLKGNACELSGFSIFSSLDGKQAAIKVTSETGAGLGNSLRNLRISTGSYDGTTIGIFLMGAQAMTVERCMITQANGIGIAFAGGNFNYFGFMTIRDVILNGCTKADFATVANLSGDGNPGAAIDPSHEAGIATYSLDVQNVQFQDVAVPKHIDMGTALGDGNTMFHDVNFNRDVVGGDLVRIPSGYTLLGRDRTGFISIIGSGTP